MPDDDARPHRTPFVQWHGRGGEWVGNMFANRILEEAANDELPDTFPTDRPWPAQPEQPEGLP